MTSAILVLNSGSSSLKFALYSAFGDAVSRLLVRGILDTGDRPALSAWDERGDVLIERDLPDGKPGDGQRMEEILEWLENTFPHVDIAAAGHRVVHGGDFVDPQLLSPDVISKLEALAALAPMHQPRCLAPVRELRRLRSSLPQIAAFDTAFHATIAPDLRRFALPRTYAESGVIKYGFHGLSYRFIAECLRNISGDLHRARTVVAHLGNGASLCALRNGRSLDTTMGFSVLDGLVMGTRCGAIDPGVILYLLNVRGMTAREVEDLLYHHSGLFGVSGISADMRTLLASVDHRAREAIDLFVFRASREVAAMTNTLQGIDCLVFTGGIGQHAAQVRAAICAQLRWLGIEIDHSANEAGVDLISAPHSDVEVRVIPTNEEKIVASDAAACLRIGASIN